ncbi:MAG TPA: hypothetical protein DCX27_00610 [Balneola sp.]|nr:hypothetical protein [Balneola sp.]
MLRKIICSLVFILLCSSYLNSQRFEKPSTSDQNKYLSSVYAEFGGAGVLLSINYDLIINETSVIRLGATPTILADPNSNNQKNIYNDEDFRITGVASYSYLFGKNKIRFEAGTGIAFGDRISYSDKPGPPALFLNFGFRFISFESKGLVFKTSFTPFIKDQQFIPWGGISIGYSFNNQI